jgi:hypothetical protein
MGNKFKNASDWYEYGLEKNWVTKIFCDTHEGPPLTDAEMIDWDEGNDPCSFHVKFIDQ